MTKDQARLEAIRLWRSLPVMERQTHQQAEAFARTLSGLLDFRTMGDLQRVLLAWLIRDLEQGEMAVRKFDARPHDKPAPTEGEHPALGGLDRK